MVPEYSCVVLLEDRPDGTLKAGDVGAVVLNHEEGGFAEVEFVALTGETVALLTLPQSAFRLARQNEVPHVRTVEAAE